MASNPKTVSDPRPAFGTVLVDHMASASYGDGRWSEAKVERTGPIELSPAAHVLHYASSCFEGFKAYRWADGSIHLFRMDRHIARMRQSATHLALPPPEARQLAEMVRSVIHRCRDQVPEAPGALYLRPLLFGTTANIGAAATPSAEATLLVLASPVWDYFAGGVKALKIYVEEDSTRTASHMGMVKTGGNYAAAIYPTMNARAKHQADQVLFAPGGQVQETGAANFLLLRDGALMTRSLDASFLHGVTRDSLLTLARDLGYRVTERAFDIEEMLAWIGNGEAALSGTAAVLAGVGTLIVRGAEHTVGGGAVGAQTRRLREALVAIQRGEAADRHGWTEPV